MDFERLSATYVRLEATPSRLEMTQIISDFLQDVDDAILPVVVLFLKGKAFESWETFDLGISDKLMLKVLSNVSGVSEDVLLSHLRDLGDIGSVSERVLVKKPQTTLFSKKLTVERVREVFDKLVTLTGKGSQDKKFAYLSELFSNASAQDARFLTRLILGQLRIGVGDGTLRDSISKAFEVEPPALERAYNLHPDWGQVALVAKTAGTGGLLGQGIVLGEPVRVMLAQKAKGLAEALGELGRAQIEYKYDGARVQIHKAEGEVRLFTRALEEVTRQFPEVVSFAKKDVRAKRCLLEGEIVAVDPKTNKPFPFQMLSRRIKRKYEIEKIASEIPVEVNLFDILHLEGEDLLDVPLVQRRKMLSDAVSESASFRLSKALVTDSVDDAHVFYEQALDVGHEGVMVKVLDSPYQPGSRVGYMYKVKPVMESLDLVVTGATWGEGRRAHWLGSYLLSAYDPEQGEYLEVGRMATGLTDEKLEELTGIFKPLIVSESGKDVVVRPEIVFEVAYEEIQRSPTYSSGYALRFPRLARVRGDKGVSEADTLQRVEDLLDGKG